MKKNLLLLVGVLVFIFATGEVTVRYLQSKDIIFDFSKGKHNQGIKKRRNFSPKLERIDNPDLFVEHKLGQRGINKWGMRGPAYGKAKPRDAYRIAIVGDSVSFGYGVPYKKSYPAMLEAGLNQNVAANPQLQEKGISRFQVINFSVNGYGVAAYAELMKSKVPEFSPDLVIVGYCLNDPAPTSVLFEAVGEAMKRNALYKRLSKYSEFLTWIKYSLDKASDNRRLKQMFNEGYEREDVIAEINRSFATVKAKSDELNAELMVVVFPYFVNFEPYKLGNAHTVIGGILEDNGIRHYDLLDTFANSGIDMMDLRVSPDDYTHPSPAGHQVIADVLVEKVLAESSGAE